MKRTVELSLEKAREWYQKGGELREVALQAYKKEELISITYRTICKELFADGISYYIDSDGDIQEFIIPTDCTMCDPNSATSAHQLKKLLAINKLVNVAKYLNNGWEPDWNNLIQNKYYISYDNSNHAFSIPYCNYLQLSTIYFKTRELAERAIEILGYDYVKLAIAENW